MADKRICVVLVVDDLGFGGAERQVIELANNMDREHFKVHVCALSNHVPLSNTLIDAHQRLHIIRKANRVDFTVVPRLASLLRKLKADIVHGFLFSAEIATRLAARMAGTRLVIGSERNANQVFRGINVLVYSLTSQCVDVIIANSHAGAASNGRIFRRPLSDYRVVHNGVDVERFKPSDEMAIRQELGIPSCCPTVGAFANFKKQKNHTMLFRVFKLVLGSFPDTRLLLVGEKPSDSRGKLNGYKSQLAHLVDELEIRHRCIFLGHQNVVERLYPACDMTVLASLHEGTPNVLLESMACGVPVVATNVCDNKRIVKDGEVGYLVEVGDDAGMVNRTELLLSNAGRRKEMGRKARNWVLEKFSTRRMAEEMQAVYMELLSKRHK